MAIRIYPIHQVLGPIERGGTTRPWVALVDDGSVMPREYVIKLFSARDLEQANYVAAEVMGSVLCGQFEIETPDFCLVSFDEHAGVNCPAAFSERMREKDYPQPWFASRSVLPHAEFSKKLMKKWLSEPDVATLFAFDCLILNTDRNDAKPNLLIKDRRVMAIDHERAFAHHDPQPSSCLSVARSHLLMPLMKKYMKQKGPGIFDSFEMFLRRLDLREWNRDLDELEELRLPFEHRAAWDNYLNGHRNDPTWLANSLRLLLK